MERLTKPSLRGDRYVSAIGSGCGCWGKIIERLAAYENTGLEPEEIGTLQAYKCLDEHERELLFEYKELGTIDYLRALVEEENADPMQYRERVRLEQIFKLWAHRRDADPRDPKNVFAFLADQKVVYVERLRRMIEDGETWNG